MERALCPVLIGRDNELSTLEDALLAANRGEGQVVLLTGDAGMGKTRLAAELTRRAQRMGMTVLIGGCSEADLPLPYLPFLEAIGNYLAASDIKNVRSRLGPIRRELAHLFPQLEPDGVPVDTTDQTSGRTRLFEAILSLLILPAVEHGLMVIVEDLHWADASTRELLDYLTRRLRNVRILVVATYRRDEMHRRHPLVPLIQGWRRRSATTIVELEALTPANVAQMVTAIFDLKEGVQDDTRDFLHARTEGNPLVLEEMLKAALDRGDIFRTATGWTRKTLADIRIPNSVRETILLRLDRLSPDQVAVLRAAAVLGQNFDYSTLVEMADLDAAFVQGAIEASIQQQLLVDVPGEAGRYRFRHALTREAIYDDMIIPHRERLHGRAADVLMARADVPASELCNHLLAGGRKSEAVPKALQAAEAAELSYAFAEAAALYEKVLSEVRGDELRATVLCRVGVAHHRSSNPAHARSYLEEGIRMLEARGDRWQAARYRLDYARCIWELGESGVAQREYEAARDVLAEFGPNEDLALAYVRLAAMRVFAFDYRVALDLAERAIAVAEQARVDLPRIWAYQYKGVALASMGRPDEGIELLDRSFEEAYARGFHRIAQHALKNGCAMRVQTFRGRELRDRLELYRRLPPVVGVQLDRLDVEVDLAHLEGRFADALGSTQQIIELADVTGVVLWRRRALIAAALALMEIGRLEEAEASLADAGPAEEAQDRSGEFECRLRLALLRGATEPARDSIERMLEEVAGWEGSPRESALDLCSAGFAALGDSAGLDRVAAIAEADYAGDPHPFRDRILARRALAGGDLARADELASSTVAFFIERGLWQSAAWSRLLLGEARAASGDPRAREVLALLATEASQRGAIAMTWRAEEVAVKSGFTLGIALAPAVGAPIQVPETVGERLVTVLFADVRGYTAMTQVEVPADMVDVIAAFQRWAIAEIERFKGHVDKFAGDAVMATFNVSGAHVDHAIHAFQCAIALIDKAAALQLPLGCGIATGAAVVGALARGANISVVGEATNLASRLQAQAHGGEILVSEETFRRLRGWLESNDHAAEPVRLELKGFDQPVPAYRIS